MSELGALVLTGGRSSRMGADKAELEWLGVRAVDRVAHIAAEAGAAPIISVGPRGHGLQHVLDDEAFGGPVGAIAAGARALLEAGCERALILAVDAPTLQLEDLRPLLAHQDPGAVFKGLHLPMVLNLRALPDDSQADWPIDRLVDRAGLARLDCPAEALARLRGANTPAEREALLQSLRTASAAAGSRPEPPERK